MPSGSKICRSLTVTPFVGGARFGRSCLLLDRGGVVCGGGGAWVRTVLVLCFWRHLLRVRLTPYSRTRWIQRSDRHGRARVSSSSASSSPPALSCEPSSASFLTTAPLRRSVRWVTPCFRSRWRSQLDLVEKKASHFGQGKGFCPEGGRRNTPVCDQFELSVNFIKRETRQI